MNGHHLAQLNVATALYSLDDPRMAGFVERLGPLNAAADAAPGFVWRLVDDEGEDATTIRPLGADVIINLTVWESKAALWDFVYRSGHLDVLRRRSDWFARPTQPFQVLWWVPAGQVPTAGEAIERLELLRREGPGPRAFTFQDDYQPEASAGALTPAQPPL